MCKRLCKNYVNNNNYNKTLINNFCKYTQLKQSVILLICIVTPLNGKQTSKQVAQKHIDIQ